MRICLYSVQPHLGQKPTVQLQSDVSCAAAAPSTADLKPAVPNPKQAAGFLRGVADEAALSEEDAKLSPEQLTRVIEERRRKNQKV